MKMQLTTQAHINSLNGKLDTVEIIAQRGDNDYIARYKGQFCSAIFNPFVCHFYVDDVYGIIPPQHVNAYTH